MLREHLAPTCCVATAKSLQRSPKAPILIQISSVVAETPVSLLICIVQSPRGAPVQVSMPATASKVPDALGEVEERKAYWLKKRADAKESGIVAGEEPEASSSAAAATAQANGVAKPKANGALDLTAEEWPGKGLGNPCLSHPRPSTSSVAVTHAEPYVDMTYCPQFCGFRALSAESWCRCAGVLGLIPVVAECCCHACPCAVLGSSCWHGQGKLPATTGGRCHRCLVVPGTSLVWLCRFCGECGKGPGSLRTCEGSAGS